MLIGRALTILSWDVLVTVFLKKEKSYTVPISGHRAAILFNIPYADILEMPIFVFLKCWF
jgi:hypothetical protein